MSHPTHYVDRPTRSVSLPMHNYRHPMHYVRLPTHFIAIRWGFCAFVGTKWPTIGKSVQKRDTERNAACRGRDIALRCHRPRRAGGTGGVSRNGCVSPVCCAAITRRGRRSAPVPILRGSRSDRMRVAVGFIPRCRDGQGEESRQRRWNALGHPHQPSLTRRGACCRDSVD